MPEEANLLDLLQQFEGIVVKLPWQEQMRLNAEVLLQLTEI